MLAVAAKAFVSAADAPRIDARVGADVHTHTSPQQIGSGTTVASPTFSVFQSDLTAIRLRWPLTWALRDARAAAVVNNVVW